MSSSSTADLAFGWLLNADDAMKAATAWHIIAGSDFGWQLVMARQAAGTLSTSASTTASLASLPLEVLELVRDHLTQSALGDAPGRVEIWCNCCADDHGDLELAYCAPCLDRLSSQDKLPMNCQACWDCRAHAHANCEGCFDASWEMLRIKTPKALAEFLTHFGLTRAMHVIEPEQPSPHAIFIGLNFNVLTTVSNSTCSFPPPANLASTSTRGNGTRQQSFQSVNFENASAVQAKYDQTAEFYYTMIDPDLFKIVSPTIEARLHAFAQRFRLPQLSAGPKTSLLTGKHEEAAVDKLGEMMLQKYRPRWIMGLWEFAG